MLRITRQHPITGDYNSRELDIDYFQYSNWKNGMLIQEAMPNLSAEEREFLISGLLPGEYDEMFKDLDEEE